MATGYRYAKMLCNGKVFPICPNWMCWEYGFMDGGCGHIIIENNGKTYLVHTGYSGILIFWVKTSTNMVHVQMGGTMWELVDGSWTNKQDLSMDAEIGPLSGVVWTDMENLPYSVSGSTKYGNTGIIGTDPINLEGASIEIYAPDSVERGKFICVYASVSGVGFSDKSYTITLSGQGESNTQLSRSEIDTDEDGVVDHIRYFLYCSPTESAESLTVTAVSALGSFLSTSKTIAITGDSSDSGSSGDSTAVTGITSSETFLELTSGASYPLTITVNGTDDYDSTVLYQLFGDGFGNNTYWDGNTIYIGKDCSAVEGSILFYSKQNPNYNIEVVVAITVPEIKACYLKQNGEFVKKTVYKRIDGEWVMISNADAEEEEEEEEEETALVSISMEDGKNIGTGSSTYDATFSGGTFENGKFILNGKGYLTISADFMNVSATTPWTVAFTIDSYTKGSSTYGRFARGNKDNPSIYYSSFVSGARIKLANGNVNSNTSGLNYWDESDVSVSSSNELYITIPTDTPTTFVFRNNGEYISLWVNGSEKMRQTASSYTSSYRASKFSIGDDAGGSYYLSHLECSMLKAWDYALSDDEIVAISEV